MTCSESCCVVAKCLYWLDSETSSLRSNQRTGTAAFGWMPQAVPVLANQQPGGCNLESVVGCGISLKRWTEFFLLFFRLLYLKARAMTRSATRQRANATSVTSATGGRRELLQVVV